MPSENNDVKLGATSSVAKQDVKATFDSTADAMIEALSKGSSPEEEKQEESVVLEKNTTEKEEKSSAVEEADATDDKEDKTEQEETEKEDKTEEGEEETIDEVKEDKELEAKHEDSIPYSRFKEVNDKASRYEGLARDQENIINYCQQNGIPAEDFRGNLEILALARSNPSEAIKRTEAFLEQLKVATGNGLPADLAKEVTDAEAEFKDGNISEARLGVIKNRMKELAKARVQHTNLEQQNRFTQLQQQQAEGQQLTGALAAWADAKRKLDPGFKPSADPTKPGKFEDFLAKNIYLWTLNPPKNAQQAIELADKALTEVNSMIARYKPTPKAKKAPLSTGHSRSTESELPKSMDDVVNHVAKKHGYSV